MISIWLVISIWLAISLVADVEEARRERHDVGAVELPRPDIDADAEVEGAHAVARHAQRLGEPLAARQRRPLREV